MRARIAMLTGALLLLAVATAPAASQTSPGPQGPEEGAMRRQLWLIPLRGERLLMHAFVLRPRGPGPFPLAVINHGSSQSSFQRADFKPSNYRHVAQWFIDRGFAVVLPIRPGHGETGGPYFEDQGRCESADYKKSGLATADSIQAAVDYLKAQAFIAGSGAVVVGQSAGGWGALALASRNPSSIRAVINFAGGRGGRADEKPNNNCVPDRLVETAGDFGHWERIPTLWLYSQNDSYFAPALSQRMFQAFRGAGGVAEYHLLPAFGTDGHAFIDSGDAMALWAPMLEKFLAEHG